MIDSGWERQKQIKCLLGELSDFEMTGLEEEYFADDKRFQDLLMVEEDLIDAYLAGRLVGADRSQFERIYLSSPTRQRRVQFLMELRKRALGKEKGGSDYHEQAVTFGGGHSRAFAMFFKRSRLRMAVGWAVLMVLVLGSAWLSITFFHSRSRLLQEETGPARMNDQNRHSSPTMPRPQAKSPREESRGNTVNAPENPILATEIVGSVASVTLLPGVSRDVTASKPLRLNKQIQRVKLNLLLDSLDAFSNYTVAIQTFDGGKIWNKKNAPLGLVDSRPALIAVISASLLPEGDYLIKVSGSDPQGRLQGVADFALSVRSK